MRSTRRLFITGISGAAISAALFSDFGLDGIIQRQNLHKLAVEDTGNKQGVRQKYLELLLPGCNAIYDHDGIKAGKELTDIDRILKSPFLEERLHKYLFETELGYRKANHNERELAIQGFVQSPSLEKYIESYKGSVKGQTEFLNSAASLTLPAAPIGSEVPPGMYFFPTFFQPFSFSMKYNNRYFQIRCEPTKRRLNAIAEHEKVHRQDYIDGISLEGLQKIDKSNYFGISPYVLDFIIAARGNIKGIEESRNGNSNISSFSDFMNLNPELQMSLTSFYQEIFRMVPRLSPSFVNQIDAKYLKAQLEEMKKKAPQMLHFREIEVFYNYWTR